MCLCPFCHQLLYQNAYPIPTHCLFSPLHHLQGSRHHSSFLLDHDKFLFKTQGPSSRGDDVSRPDSCSHQLLRRLLHKLLVPALLSLDQVQFVLDESFLLCIPSSQSVLVPLRPDRTWLSILLCPYLGQEVLSKENERRTLWHIFTLHIPGCVRPVLPLTCISFSGRPIFFLSLSSMFREHTMYSLKNYID